MERDPRVFELERISFMNGYFFKEYEITLQKLLERCRTSESPEAIQGSVNTAEEVYARAKTVATYFGVQNLLEQQRKIYEEIIKYRR